MAELSPGPSKCGCRGFRDRRWAAPGLATDGAETASPRQYWSGTRPTIIGKTIKSLSVDLETRWFGPLVRETFDFAVDQRFNLRVSNKP